jgi:glycosyltransferase involved in cell wall biosynthesis
LSASLPLSVIVIGYDMARELPRTIRSLSPALQRDIAAADYEILVVDNGSRSPPTAEEVAGWSANARLIIIAQPTVSPVPAINLALAQARGELVGVLIDGARMASPRLLATALEAARVHERAVVGTLAFHLGPDVQMRSVPAGYDQGTEDRLLAASGWEDDPYRLFGISVFAGSSAAGWFVTPAETNALFLARAHWQELGGYDPRFVAPGGGLANLDIWERLCADPQSRIILLIGEATFHQVHGGVATNALQSPFDRFHAEYVEIRGKPFAAPQVAPLLIGRAHPASLASLRLSLSAMQG